MTTKYNESAGKTFYVVPEQGDDEHHCQEKQGDDDKSEWNGHDGKRVVGDGIN
jgi:hypothetical protein